MMGIQDGVSSVKKALDRATAARFEPALQRFLNSKSADGKKRIAVFDADGTLWRGDCGDVFFEYQRHNNLLAAAPASGAELLTHYNEVLAKEGHERAYELVNEWNAGAKESDLKKWIADCWAKNPCSIIESQAVLIRELTRVGVEVWVVSASMWWLVAHAVESLGVPAERVIAARLKTKNGVITNEWEYPLPYCGGKVTAIQALIKQAPHLVSGNSMGDYDMMLLAQELVLVMSTAGPNSPYYATEQEVVSKAKKPPTKAQWVCRAEG